MLQSTSDRPITRFTTNAHPPHRPESARIEDKLQGGNWPSILFSVVLAVSIFLVDVLTPFEGAVAVLYVVVVLFAARAFRRSGLIATTLACLALTAAAYLISHGIAEANSALLRAFVSLAAIAISTGLALRNQAAAEKLAQQARLLDLTHDSIFVRDHGELVTFWNRGAEALYGFSAEQAVGRNVHVLLQTVFPTDLEAIRAELLRTGRWEGELVQRMRSGQTVTVESRWALQRDVLGKPVSVLEANTDISERKHAYAALVESERRYRTIFDTTRVSILQQDWTNVKEALEALAVEPSELEAYLADNSDFVRRMRRSITIVDVNAVTLKLIGAEDKGQFLHGLDELLAENETSFPRALLALARGETFFEGETQIRSVSGSHVPILFGITFPAPAEGYGCVLVFAVDITERKEAQETLLAVQAELAHAARALTLGELTASIAHEVNQPLAAIVTNGEAALRWLKRPVPDLEEVQAAVTRVVASGTRAGEIVARIRNLLIKAPPRPDWVDLSEMIDEAVALIEREVLRHRVSLIREIEPELPAVFGDKVQLQQVVINLMVNAVQAMSATTGRPRLLVVGARRAGEMIEVSVSDSGLGLSPEVRERVFHPFFTTKSDGMGMGLAICCTSIKAHGGELWAAEPGGPGAAFHFTVPVSPGRLA